MEPKETITSINPMDTNMTLRAYTPQDDVKNLPSLSCLASWSSGQNVALGTHQKVEGDRY